MAELADLAGVIVRTSAGSDTLWDALRLGTIGVMTRLDPVVEEGDDPVARAMNRDEIRACKEHLRSAPELRLDNNYSGEFGIVELLRDVAKLERHLAAFLRTEPEAENFTVRTVVETSMRIWPEVIYDQLERDLELDDWVDVRVTAAEGIFAEKLIDKVCAAWVNWTPAMAESALEFVTIRAWLRFLGDIQFPFLSSLKALDEFMGTGRMAQEVLTDVLVDHPQPGMFGRKWNSALEEDFRAKKARTRNAGQPGANARLDGVEPRPRGRYHIEAKYLQHAYSARDAGLTFEEAKKRLHGGNCAFCKESSHDLLKWMTECSSFPTPVQGN